MQPFVLYFFVFRNDALSQTPLKQLAAGETGRVGEQKRLTRGVLVDSSKVLELPPCASNGDGLLKRSELSGGLGSCGNIRI